MPFESCIPKQCPQIWGHPAQQYFETKNGWRTTFNIWMKFIRNRGHRHLNTAHSHSNVRISQFRCLLVNFQCSCQRFFRLGSGLCPKKLTMLETRRASFDRLPIEIGAFSLHRLIFVAIFPLGCIRARFSLFFQSICYDLRVLKLVSEVWVASTPNLRQPLHKLGDVGGFLLLRLLQRGSIFSKESINPNSRESLQLFSSSEDWYSTMMVFVIFY